MINTQRNDELKDEINSPSFLYMSSGNKYTTPQK